jgi:hemoglobin
VPTNDVHKPGESLYQRIGGAPVVERLIASLYERVDADAELAPFFAKTPMDRLRRMQCEFFAVALDAEPELGAWDLSRAHSGRGVTAEHYTRFVAHLLDALVAVGVSLEDACAVASRLSVVQRDVTGDAY